MRTSEKLLWTDGHTSTLSHEDILTRQKYDPKLGYYFNYAETTFVFRANMWMEL